MDPSPQNYKVKMEIISFLKSFCFSSETWENKVYLLVNAGFTIEKLEQIVNFLINKFDFLT